MTSDANGLAAGGAKFSQLLNAAADLPGVKVDRASYLRLALKRYCTDEQIAAAIADTPAAAGISSGIINKAANTSIKYEAGKVTTLSTLAGLPGGLAMLGAIPADLIQYFGHVLRIAQKLAYLYSWPALFTDADEDLDEATEGILTLFVGVMFGVQMAQGAVTKISTVMATQVAKKLPQKALTQGIIYPIVKKVAGLLSVRMTKQIFASGVAKVFPVIGAGLSGGLTLATFWPMSYKLQKHLASLELTKPKKPVPESDDSSV